MFTIKNSLFLDSLHFLLIALLIITMPYYLTNNWIGTLSILLFFIPLIQGNISIKSILQEKTVLFLFIFIMISILSFLWTDITLSHKNEVATIFDNFKYYLLIIPSIYFSNITQQQIYTLFKILAISPFIYILTYYSNALGLTYIVSTHFSPTNGYTFLYVDLIGNFFILLSTVYLYISALLFLKERKFLFFFLTLSLFLLVSGALFVYPTTTTRTINLPFFILLFAIPLYLFKTHSRFILPLIVLLCISTFYFLAETETYNKGIKEVEKAINGNFSGSWGYRMGLIEVGYELFKERPILGYGPLVKEKILEIKKIHPELFAHQPTIHFHNEHIMILARTGIFGYIFFILFIFSFYRLSITSKEFFILKNSLIMILIVIFFGEEYFTFKTTTNSIAILIGLFLLYHKLDQLNALKKTEQP